MPVLFDFAIVYHRADIAPKKFASFSLTGSFTSNIFRLVEQNFPDANTQQELAVYYWQTAAGIALITISA
jgi:hypothetical protein